MRTDYEKQISDHNIKKLSLMKRVDLEIFFSTKILSQSKQNAELHINLVTGIKKIIEDLKYHFGKNKWQKL